MRILSTFLITFAFIVTIKAQDPDVFKAKELLDKISAKTKGYTSIKADFSITLENLQANTSDTYSGKILMKGSKYKVEVMGTEIYYDGKTMWTHLLDAKEVTISDASNSENDILDPASLFTIYEKGYKYIYAGETTIGGKKVDIIDLFPEKRDKPYSRIKIYVYRDNLQFAKISQMGRDGNNYLVDIKKMEVNVPADDAMFRFDTKKHPEVEVIDIR
ncbi:MAG: outer membrane lipoprotein carrier protein LolA [Marinilabiliaceae bacterium]|nr:outer membrane lipoprotein carrier protein LolA [Marinilabiliaceae bacterium]